MLGIFFVCYFVLWVRISEELPNTASYLGYISSNTTDDVRNIQNNVLRWVNYSLAGVGNAYVSATYDLDFNMGRGNSTYKDGAKVRPNSVEILYCIRF